MLLHKAVIMEYFDLHFDTLYRIKTENLAPYSHELSVTPNELKAFDKFSGFMAVWVPDCIRKDDAFRFFEDCASIYNKFFKSINDDRYKFYLSVENGSVIGGDISKISALKEYGVKAVTIVYNEDNELGSGAFSDSEFGLTSKGIEAVKEFERQDIVVDLSHSSVRTFYDVAENSSKPIIATHSNSYSLCPNRRNLTDEQFKIIRDSGGVVGVNFYPPFLCSEPESATVYDVIKHIYHFLSLDGENTVCIGSDFDGCDALETLDRASKIPVLYESLLKHGFNEQLIQKILYYNAQNFITRF